MTPTLYHNPRCSKSRQGLALLTEKGIDVSVREYLKQPLDKTELTALFAALNVSPAQALRKKEADYKASGLTNDASDDDIINALIAYPKLLERPILNTEKGARIGRPTEALLEVL